MQFLVIPIIYTGKINYFNEKSTDMNISWNVFFYCTYFVAACYCCLFVCCCCFVFVVIVVQNMKRYKNKSTVFNQTKRLS